MADDVVLHQAGSVAAVAAMGALFAARRTGEAQHVDVSIFESQAGSIDRRMSTLIAYQYTGGTSGRRPMENTGGYPQGVFPCKDGYVEITGGGIYFPGRSGCSASLTFSRRRGGTRRTRSATPT